MVVATDQGVSITLTKETVQELAFNAQLDKDGIGTIVLPLEEFEDKRTEQPDDEQDPELATKYDVLCWLAQGYGLLQKDGRLTNHLEILAAERDNSCPERWRLQKFGDSTLYSPTVQFIKQNSR